MKTNKLILALLLAGVITSSAPAVQRHVLVYDTSKPREGQKNINVVLHDDGDLHIIDIDLCNRIVNDRVRRGLLIAAAPHAGIWIRSDEAPENLPERIVGRWFYISDDGTDRKAKNRPTTRTTIDEEPAEKMLSAANTAYDVGSYSEAAALYLQCFNEYPQNRVTPFAMYMAGQCLCAQQKYKESIAMLKAVAGKYPGENVYYRSLYRIGCILCGQLEKRKEGIAVFQSLLNKSDTPGKIKQDCLFNIASLHLIEGKIKQATEEYTLLIKLFPGGKRAKAAQKNILSVAQSMIQGSKGNK